MFHRASTVVIGVAVSVFPLLGCRVAAPLASRVPIVASHAEQEADLALQKYVQALRRQDSVALAALFSDGATMGHEGQTPVVGRDAIKRFLDSFSGYQIISHDMKVMTVSSTAATVVQAGNYQQTVRTPEGTVVTVQGTFTFEWRHQSDGQWLLYKARTAASHAPNAA